MAKKKSTTKKTASTKKAAKKTVTKAVKKTAKKADKKVAVLADKKPAKKKPAKAGKERPVAEIVKAAPVAEAPPVDVATIAYQIYLERIEKGIPGDEIGDWAAAEQRVQTA